MVAMEHGAPARIDPGARNTAAGLSLLGAIAGIAITAWLVVQPGANAFVGVDRGADAVSISLLAAGSLFMLLAAIVVARRLGLGGAISLIGVLFWFVGCIVFKSFSWTLAAPAALGFLGAMTGMVANDRHAAETDAALIYRQSGLTRLTHWVWAFAMFFMLLSGLQIFNSRPNLYIGQQSGFGFDNSILDFGLNDDGSIPQVRIFGHVWDQRGYQGTAERLPRSNYTAVPGWATIPSYHDLGAGRVVHFFFAWILVGTLSIWLINAISIGHMWRDIILKPRDIRGLPKDILDHIRLRFTHGRSYTPLQKIAYFGVFVVAFPLIILTGLTMSPGMDAAWPWLAELFGGRQTARTIHFLTMCSFVLFFVVHVVMVVLAGPVNELRSMITGYYRTNVQLEPESKEGKH
jgi:thiosulfate reductase cytochrome b subunit